MSNNPYDASKVQPNLGGGGSGDDSSAIASYHPMAGASFWLKLIGTVNLIMGVLYCLTIVGAVVGWVPIWMGIKLNSAGSLYKQGVEARSLQMLRNANNDLATALTIMGVLMLIGVIITALYIIGAILMLVLFAGAASMN